MISDRTATLLAAYTLISGRAQWTEGILARGKDGIGIDPTNSGAIQWCAVGAIQAVGMHIDNINPARHLIDMVVEKTSRRFTNIIEVNDGQGHAATLRMFEKAICVSEQMDEEGL